MSQVTRCVGRYELREEIGRGGMAVVYRALQTDLRRLVAVKELGALHTPDRSLAQRFVFEARLAGSLSHPNVVTVFDFFEHAGIPYIAMEYLPRGSLRGYLRHLTLAQAAGVFDGLLAGLAHAEEDGVVHRDLKPENIMVSRDGRVKIADFGIAKASGDVQTGGFRTATGTTIGTPAYMAPEQAMGKELGPWTDLYAVGVIAFELFSGRVPFSDAETPMAVMFRHVEEPIPPVRTLNPTVHEGISDWIERLLVKDAAHRTRSARRAWEELEEIVIDVLGPRWRRNSPITEPVEAELDGDGAHRRSTYETFHVGDPPGAGVGGPATPPPVDLPAGPMMPSTPDILVGPSTPAPLDARTDERASDAGNAAAAHDDDATIAPRPSPPGQEARRSPAMPEAPLGTPRAGRETRAAPEPKPGAASAAHPPERRPNRRRLFASAAILALLVSAAVVALSGGAQDAPPPASSRALVTGPVNVRLPAGWQPTAAPAVTARLALISPGAAAPAGNPARGSVTIGLGPTSASNASLLRPAFADDLAAPPQPARTTMGDLPGSLQAYRYDHLQPRGGDKSLTIYTAPTSVGVATIACAAPTPSAACEQIARTLAVKDATAFPVGASADYAIRVNRSLRLLAKALARQDANIRAANTARGQANAATAIAGAFRRGRGPLTAGPLSPADVSANAALLDAFGRAADAYTALARAARQRRRAAYERAGERARGAQVAITAAIAELTTNGYSKHITERYRMRTIPRLKRPISGPKRPTPTATPFEPVTPVAPRAPAAVTPPPGVTPPPPPPAKQKPQFVP